MKIMVMWKAKDCLECVTHFCHRMWSFLPCQACNGAIFSTCFILGMFYAFRHLFTKCSCSVGFRSGDWLGYSRRLPFGLRETLALEGQTQDNTIFQRYFKHLRIWASSCCSGIINKDRWSNSTGIRSLCSGCTSTMLPWCWPFFRFTFIFILFVSLWAELLLLMEASWWEFTIYQLFKLSFPFVILYRFLFCLSCSLTKIFLRSPLMHLVFPVLLGL